MTPEQRAALERAVEVLKTLPRPETRFSDREVHAKALQALLSDEKGGDGPAREDFGLPVAGAASTAPPVILLQPNHVDGCRCEECTPPDSPAKIAAEIRRCTYDIRYHLSGPLRDGLDQDLRAIAARVEALALEPGERVEVVDAWCELRALRHRGEDQESPQVINEWLDDIIAALTPIAERKP